MGCFSEVTSRPLHGREPNLVFICLHRGKGQLSECEPHRSHAKAFPCYDMHAIFYALLTTSTVYALLAKT